MPRVKDAAGEPTHIPGPDSDYRGALLDDFMHYLNGVLLDQNEPSPFSGHEVDEFLAQRDRSK